MEKTQPKYLENVSGLITDMKDPEFLYRIPYLTTEEKIYIHEETQKLYLNARNTKKIPFADVFVENMKRLSMNIACDISKWDKAFMIYSMKTKLPFISFDKYNTKALGRGRIIISEIREYLESDAEDLSSRGYECEVREILNPAEIIRTMVFDWGCAGVILVSGVDFVEFRTEIPYDWFLYQNRYFARLMLFAGQCNDPEREVNCNVADMASSDLNKIMLYVPVTSAQSDEFTLAFEKLPPEKQNKKLVRIPAYLTPGELDRFCILRPSEIFRYAKKYGKNCEIVVNPETIDFILSWKTKTVKRV